MTSPQDPFAAPDPSTPTTGGLPSYQAGPYGEPPAAQAGFGTPPAYGTAPGAWQGPPLASWGTRVGGFLIDGLISSFVQFGLGRINHGLGQIAGLVVFLVFAYMTGSTGQTPGRKAVGVKILREVDGQVLGFGAAIGRSLLHILDAIPLLLGFFWPIWDAKNQTFADKIIKSVAIKV